MIRVINTIHNLQEYAVTPVSVAELKAYLQVEGSAYDTQFQALLWAATQQVEEYTNISLTPKLVQSTFEQRGSSGVRLPYSPLDAIVTAKWKRCPISYIDATYTIVNDGEEDAIFVGENYSGSMPWPTYRVEYTTVAADIYALKEAVKVQAAYMYAQRDDGAAKSWSMVAKALMNAHRKGNF